MRRPLISFLTLVASAALITGCAPAASTPGETPTSTPSATPTSEVAPHIVVAIDGLTFVEGDDTTSAAFDEPDAVLALLEGATGQLPEPEAIEDLPGYDFNLQSYTWDGLTVTTSAEGEGPASIAITGADIDGIPVATDEGLQVGSTRDDLLSAGAEAMVPAENADTAETLRLGRLDVPDTESLTHPGSTGSQFLLFLLEGDTVTQLQAPSNDFTDL